MNINDITIPMIAVLFVLVGYFSFLNKEVEAVDVLLNNPEKSRMRCGSSIIYISIDSSGLIDHSGMIFSEDELILHLKRDDAEHPLNSFVISADEHIKHEQVVTLTSLLKIYFPEISIAWNYEISK